MLIQFSDKLPKSKSNSAKLSSFALIPRGASKNTAQLNAKMSVEVTEILLHILNDELV